MNQSTSKAGSSSCQCSTILYEMQRGRSKEQCEHNSQAFCGICSQIHSRSLSFLGPGSVEKWYGTYTHKTRWIMGSNGRRNDIEFLWIQSSNNSCLQCLCERTTTKLKEEARSQCTSMVAMEPSSLFSAQ